MLSEWIVEEEGDDARVEDGWEQALLLLRYNAGVFCSHTAVAESLAVCASSGVLRVWLLAREQEHTHTQTSTSTHERKWMYTLTYACKAIYGHRRK